jgi:mannose-1-phosphate guanylyltransferase
MEKISRNNHFIVILCGGTGPRLWPLSRASHPKQFLELLSPDSLLQQTLKRAIKIVPQKNVFIVSNRNHIKDIVKNTKGLIPKANIITEPLKKNTAMAILLAVSYIKKINPDAVISTFPADHYISNISKFSKDIKKVQKIAENHELVVTIGIKPDYPNPAYGYIVPSIKESSYFKVSRFVEKPDQELGKKLIQKNAFWNSGIYTFSISTIESEFRDLQPEYFQLYQKLITNLNQEKQLEDIYLNSPELPIDKAISEKSSHMAVVQAIFGWSDIGEWKTIFINSTKDKNGIALINKNTQVLSVQSSDCLVSSEGQRLIGLVGINNLAIIDTSDALLVCNLDNSYNVRDLVSLIVKSKKTEKYFLIKK